MRIIEINKCENYYHSASVIQRYSVSELEFEDVVSSSMFFKILLTSSSPALLKI